MIDKNSDKEKLTNKRRAIQKISLLPSIPATLQKIIETSGDPKSSAEDLQHVIEKDQAISAAILKLSNSAYYGYARQVDDIKRAIVIIGFNTSVSVAISISVLKSLSGKMESAEFSRESFWKHTIAAGEAARMIAKESKFPNQAQAYVIGLLHDIGKVVLNFIDAKEFDDAVFESRAVGKPLYTTELHMFGFDHQEAGGWLGDKWKLPEPIVMAIRHHNDLSGCPAGFKAEATIAYLSNYCAKTAKIGDSGDATIPALRASILDTAGISKDTLSTVTSELEKKREEIDLFLEVLL